MTGIVLGILYGILTRIYFNDNIASITYMVIIPAVIGIIPLFFRDKQKESAWFKIIFIPWIAMLGFFLALFIFGIEDLLCFFILSAPFFVILTLTVFLFQLVSINQANKKNKLLCIAILPFLIMPIEEAITTPSESYTVKNEVVINAPPNKIWDNIVEVDNIQENEYNSGILNWLGLPRPVNATVTKKAAGGIRTGTFEGGLQFTEVISKYEDDKHIAFDISIAQTSKTKKVFEEHVLKGNYFSFVNASYTLVPTQDGKIKLQLYSKYILNSKVNFYGRFWADIMIQDFQDRLLKVIAARCEKQ